MAEPLAVDTEEIRELTPEERAEMKEIVDELERSGKLDLIGEKFGSHMPKDEG